jgi:3-oxoacyl-[acyl-carrier protein] reductase
LASRVKGRLEGRVAVITGASRGIGRASALAFAREGAKVVMNYSRERDMAERAVDEIRRRGGRSIAIQADVADRGAVEEMVHQALREFGTIDILMNNAGVMIGGGPLQQLKDEDLDRMWKVNVKGILNCTRAVAPHMTERRRGKVINLSSVAGIGTAILPGNTLYAATKAAVVILTKRLALELGRHGISVNAIAPGLIRTDMGVRQWRPEEVDEHIRYFEENSILGRIGEPEEIASVALFLASDESSFITGQTLVVDGGRIDYITHSI